MLADHHPGVLGEPATIGKVLTRLRNERGYTQRQLATKLCEVSSSITISRHELSRWERGGRIPGPFWLKWLAVALEAPPEQLEAAVAATRARQGRRSLLLPRNTGKHRLWRPINARDLLTMLEDGETHDLPRLAHEWLVGPPEIPDLISHLQLAEPPALAPGAGDGTGRDLLAGLPAQLERLRRADDVIGGLDLAEHADRQLREAVEVLRRIGSGRLQWRALQLVAEHAQLAGWVHADAGDYAPARRAYRVALQTSAVVGDRDLVAYVLASLSHQSLTAEQPQEALLLARTGQAGLAEATSADKTDGESGSSSCLLQALLLYREALAAAQLGERKEAELTLVNAERVVDRVRPDEEPPWLYWLDESELMSMTGRCFAVLGRRARAVRVLRDRPSGAGPRSTALYDGWLAYAYLQLGEVEEASRVAGRALADAAASGSARVSEALGRLRSVLRRQGDGGVYRERTAGLTQQLLFPEPRTDERARWRSSRTLADSMRTDWWRHE